MSDPTPPAGSSPGTTHSGRVEGAAHGASASGAASGGHRIDISVNNHRVRVIHHGVTIADTQAALTLSETGLPDVLYFPRGDVNMARLESSAHTSHCPFKGDASYFHLLTEDGVVENAVWSYETPFERGSRRSRAISRFMRRASTVSIRHPDRVDGAFIGGGGHGAEQRVTDCACTVRRLGGAARPRVVARESRQLRVF
jgi:uncharacterized protein (DUF427 family)